jgi:hypothetical protein
MRIHSLAVMMIALPAIAQSPQDAIVAAQRKAAKTDQNPYSTPAAIKYAPYSADAITETTQVLSDGNRIQQRTTQKLYRDAEGRERREESVFAVGPLAQPDAPRLITISDPVANVTYTLDPQQSTARRSSFAEALVNTILGNILRNAGRAGSATKTASARPTETMKENLGSKNIEGVIAQGTRTTKTIPAGKIGNLLPINIVDEVWHSSELHLNVLTTHHDPRTGDTVYKLINISRANPPQSLFEPPVGYTIIGGHGGVRGPQ